MITKTTLDMLTEKSVSVKTQIYVEYNGAELPVGEPHRRAFINSERGRAELAAALENGEITKSDFDAITSKWGNSPTVFEANI